MADLPGSPDRKNPRQNRPGLIERLEERRLFNTTTIAWNTINQTITGFGASSAWTTQSVTNSQSQLLFSPTDGAGLSMLRSRINEDSTTLAPGTPQPAGSYEIQTMQAAAAMGVTVWSTPWSPPAAWKSNQSVDDGGYLLAADYQAYANYLAQYVVTMKNDGIPLYGISLQNEPDFTADYDSCTWTAAEFAAFLPDVVTAFANYGVSGTKIIFPEESGWHWELANTVMTTPSLNADVSVYADHDYDNGSGTVPGAAGKQLWMTEVSDPNSATGIAAGLWVAQNVYNMIVTSGANAYDYWWIQDGGASGNGQLLGPNWGQTQLFWGLANYSKFIRPGWNNISETNDNGLTASAYADTATGQFATVLVNSGSSAINETINISGAYAPVLTPWVTSATLNLVQQTPIPATGNGSSFTYTIPAQSIVTLTGTASTTPVTSPPPGLAATSAGSTGMSLAWTSNVTAATGYTVQRSTDDTNWTTLSSNVSSSTYSYTDSPLTPNTLYYYRVIANNGSVYSNVSYAETLPNPVTGLTATFNTNSLAVTLNWMASTSGGVDYMVERSSDGGGTWTPLTSAVGNGTNTYTDSSAPDAAPLEYEVLAIDGANASLAATTTITTTVLPAPSDLTATAGTIPGSVALNWTNNSNEPASTFIERSSNGGGNWTDLGSVASGVSTYTDPAPGSGAFDYVVYASFNSVTSANSSSASYTVSLLNLNGSTGNNTYYLKDSGSTLDIWINSATPGSGTPTQTDPLNNFSSISIIGGAGNDSVTLDYSGGDPTSGSIVFANSSSSPGTDTLTIKGETGGSTSTLSATSLIIGSDTISYTNLAYLDLDLGGGSSRLTANSPDIAPLLTLTVDPGSTLALGPSSTLAANTILGDSGTFNLSGESESIDQITGLGTINSSGGTLTIGSFNGSSSFAGGITGALSFDKIGSGTFTCSGDISYTGNTTVDTGILTFAPITGADNIGSITSSVFVAPANTDKGTLNIGPNANFTAGGTYGGLFIACNSDSNNGGGIGTINQTGGTLTVASGVVYLAGANTVNDGADAVWNFSGGTANLSANLTMSINNDSVSYLNISGTAQLNMLNNTSIYLGTYYTRPATITQTGGTVTYYSDAGATVGGTGTLDLNNGGGTCLYNLAGGVLDVPSITATDGSAALNLSGGTLEAAASSSSFIASGVATRVRSGGAIIDPNGHAVTITGALVHDSTLGSTADGGLTVMGGGSLTLSGASTYSGPTNVSAGTLSISGTGTVSTSRGLSVGTDGTFEYLPASAGTLSFASGSTLTLAGGSTIGLAFGDKISVSGAASLTATVSLVLSETPTTGTAYTLLEAGSGLGTASEFHVIGPPGYVDTVTDSGTSVQATPTVSTTTVVTSSSSSSSFGQSVEFTATVTPANGGGESGTVQFQIDGSNVGSAVTITGGAASYTATMLGVGTHSVVAVYSGDSNCAGSISAAFTQTVSAAPLQLTGTNYLELDPTVAGQLDVWAGTTNAGPATSTYLLSKINSITDTGTAGNDTLTVNFANGNPLAVAAPGLSFDAAVTAQLVIAGDNDGDTFNVSAGQILVSGGSGTSAFNAVPITFSNVDSESILAGTGPDVLWVTGNATVRYTAAAAGAGGTYPTALLSSLSITSGSAVVFNSPDASRALLELGSANSWSGQLDLGSNDMLVPGGASALDAINSLIATGYNRGGWNGVGIASSSAATNSSHLSALGAILNNQSGAALFNSNNLFDGVVPAATDLLVKYTCYGDANLDGKVDASDYSLIDNGYLNHLTGWYNGDFNYDGVINGSDYTLIDNAYNMQGASLAAQIAPTTAAASVKPSVAGIPPVGESALAVTTVDPISKPAPVISGLDALVARDRESQYGVNGASAITNQPASWSPNVLMPAWQETWPSAANTVAADLFAFNADQLKSFSTLRWN